MSSMMVHCFKLCVIKIILPLSLSLWSVELEPRPDPVYVCMYVCRFAWQGDTMDEIFCKQVTWAVCWRPILVSWLWYCEYLCAEPSACMPPGPCACRPRAYILLWFHTTNACRWRWLSFKVTSASQIHFVAASAWMPLLRPSACSCIEDIVRKLLV